MKLANVITKLVRTLEMEVSYHGRPIYSARPGKLRPSPDVFEPARPSGPDIGVRPVTPLQTDKAFVTTLYRELLGREPDADGMAAHLAGLSRGTTRQELRGYFLNSSEYIELHTPKPPPVEVPPPVVVAPPAVPAPVVIPEPGAALSTVPLKPEYAVAIDKSSDSAAVLSAATWVRNNRPEMFIQGDDRQLAFQMMTVMIGILRANGYDATRVVNHPSFPVGAGMRYGSDAVVVNGEIFDTIGGMGEQNRPQAMDAGPYEAGRLRE